MVGVGIICGGVYAYAQAHQTPVDKAELNSLINDAMKINEKENEKDTYTQESWDDFQKGLSIAEAVNKKENPSQSDVTKAVNLLVKYTKGLEKNLIQTIIRL